MTDEDKELSEIGLRILREIMKTAQNCKGRTDFSRKHQGYYKAMNASGERDRIFNLAGIGKKRLVNGELKTYTPEEIEEFERWKAAKPGRKIEEDENAQKQEEQAEKT